MKLGLKTWIISSFREIFLYHHRSLEFRAKILALMVASPMEYEKDCDIQTLQDVIKEIYPDDKKRQDVLMHTTKEYIYTLLKNPKTSYDDFIKDIDLEVRVKRELIKKIDIEQLKRFIRSDVCEERGFLQLRVYEFLESLTVDN